MKELISLILHFDFQKLFFAQTQNSIIQFFRYAFVGGIATVVDWGVLFLLTRAGMYYLISAVFGFFSGLAVNFILSKCFVFNGMKTCACKAVEFAVYAAIGAMGLGFTLGIMYVLTEICHLFYMLSKVTSTLIVLFWNYAARKKILYRFEQNQ